MHAILSSEIIKIDENDITVKILPLDKQTWHSPKYPILKKEFYGTEQTFYIDNTGSNSLGKKIFWLKREKPEMWARCLKLINDSFKKKELYAIDFEAKYQFNEFSKKYKYKNDKNRTPDDYLVVNISAGL